MIKDRQRIYKKLKTFDKIQNTKNIKDWQRIHKKMENSNQIQNICQLRLPNRCRIDKRTMHRTNTGQM